MTLLQYGAALARVVADERCVPRYIDPDSEITKPGGSEEEEEIPGPIPSEPLSNETTATLCRDCGEIVLPEETHVCAGQPVAECQEWYAGVKCEKARHMADEPHEANGLIWEYTT